VLPHAIRHRFAPLPATAGCTVVCPGLPGYDEPASDPEERISMYPSVPCTRIRCPSRISRVA
jgi:hypothetical protein